MKQCLKSLWSYIGKDLIIVITFAVVCFSKLPTIVANKFATGLINLLTYTGIDVSKPLNPVVATSLFAATVVLMIIAALALDRTDTDKE